MEIWFLIILLISLCYLLYESDEGYDVIELGKGRFLIRTTVKDASALFITDKYRWAPYGSIEKHPEGFIIQINETVFMALTDKKSGKIISIPKLLMFKEPIILLTEVKSMINSDNLDIYICSPKVTDILCLTVIGKRSFSMMLSKDSKWCFSGINYQDSFILISQTTHPDILRALAYIPILS